MRNVSIIGKFLTVFAIFGVFALCVAGYAATQIKSIDSAYSDLIANDNEAAFALLRANRSLQTGRAAMADLMIAFTQDGNARAEAEIKSNRSEFLKQMEHAIGLTPSNAELPLLKTAGLDIFDTVCTRSLILGRAAANVDQAVASQKIFGQECQPTFTVVGNKFLDEAQKISDGNLSKSNILSDTTDVTALSAIIGVIVGFVAVFAIGFVAIRAWLVSPIRSLAGIMGTLANGDLNADVLGTDRHDEVGAMAKAVQVFKDNGLKARALAAESDTVRCEAEAWRQRTAETDRIRAEAMTQATAGLGKGLKHLASGDLTFKLTEPFAADFETLRTDFNAAVRQLSETLAAVAAATSAIDNGSREVSASADDLSKRTEQQAASLEETAAALDQITVNVANSSICADEARQIAVQANDSAVQSGHVVGDAVEAMQRIEQSSNEISSIIGVIDEIAFQTNLLALNAGVEAARAGEAGKGFAVVAQEVRELAQRSAKAAKEIKDLIRNSSAEVENGVKLVSDTGAALKTIEHYIVTVNQHMESIATSAKEQSVGLTEVNTAVNQMDQVTQQNAAMVEETSAAGASLANESGRLRDLIGHFQLGDELRQTAAVMVAYAGRRPVTSPVHRLSGTVAKSFAGNASIKDSWETF